VKDEVGGGLQQYRRCVAQHMTEVYMKYMYSIQGVPDMEPGEAWKHMHEVCTTTPYGTY